MLVHKTEVSLKVELALRGIEYTEEMLKIGDCIVSERTCVEIKRGSYSYGKYNHDFVASIKDGRLFDQCQNLRDNYANPVLIIEEFCKLYEDLSVSPSAISSSIVSITTKYGIHVIPSRNLDETIAIILKLREYDGTEGYSKPINKVPKGLSVSEQQIFLLSGLLHVGYNKAAELLTTLGSPMKVFDAITTSVFIKPTRGTKKKLESIFNELKGYGPKFVEDNKNLLTHSFESK